MGTLTQLVNAAAKAVPFPAGGARSTAFQNMALVQAIRESAGLPGERSYASLIGDGSGNSIVSSCVNWIGRNFPEARLVVAKEDAATGIAKMDPCHAAARLVSRPNPFYSSSILWRPTFSSYVCDGNAYWLKRRSVLKRVVELWYIPHHMIRPVGPDDGSAFITHYEYRTRTGMVPVAPADIVHFRCGLDPLNPRLGLSDLHALLREIFVDEEAARFIAAILHNLGMPGLILAPDLANVVIDETRAEAIKTTFIEKFGGDKRGEPMVLSLPTKVTPVGFSPKDLDLAALRDTPEERITSAIGLHAAVVGLGPGLQSVKGNGSMREARESSWENCLIPMARVMGEVLTQQLLPDFAGKDDEEMAFDLTRVRALQDDEARRALRWSRLAQSKIAKRSEARAAMGLPVDLAVDDVYLDIQGQLPDDTGSQNENSGDGGGSNHDRDGAAT